MPSRRRESGEFYRRTKGPAALANGPAQVPMARAPGLRQPSAVDGRRLKTAQGRGALEESTSARAAMPAGARFEAPSRSKMAVSWFFTVLGAMPSFLAIPLFRKLS